VLGFAITVTSFVVAVLVLVFVIEPRTPNPENENEEYVTEFANRSAEAVCAGIASDGLGILCPTLSTTSHGDIRHDI
jgi:hypothetical protein